MSEPLVITRFYLNKITKGALKISQRYEPPFKAPNKKTEQQTQRRQTLKNDFEISNRTFKMSLCSALIPRRQCVAQPRRKPKGNAAGNQLRNQ